MRTTLSPGVEYNKPLLMIVNE